jgi:nucleoside-diphosphate-sugar epimerase
MRADYVTGSFISLSGPGTGIGVLFTPYRRAWQTLIGATIGFARLVLTRQGSYAGLETLIRRFYSSVAGRAPAAMSPQSILETVSICERLSGELEAVEQRDEQLAQERLRAVEARDIPGPRRTECILVTGGTGLLGRRVVLELRAAGFSVRSVSRRLPRFAERVAGAEYRTADLGTALPADLLRGVTAVVHAAAETAGGHSHQEKNSIAATRHVIEAAARAHVRRVVHISSLAVLKPSAGAPLNEASPVDAGNLERGAYVWGKAESEVVAVETAKSLGVTLKVVRPGPLVDFEDFSAPGRLGREAGPLFVAIGPAGSSLSVCDVGTAARVIRHYMEEFERAPQVLNLVQAPPPTRRALVRMLRETRRDLRVVWFPGILLRILSGPLRLVQRFAFGSKRPVDVYSAFASQAYDTRAAADIIQRVEGTNSDRFAVLDGANVRS